VSAYSPSPSLALPPLFEPSLFAAGGAGSVVDLLAPGGLALLGLLAPLIVLYILKIRRNRRVVSSTWLWATAQRDLMARSPFKRLILQLPLILQALALIGLALALARPATRGRELTGDHVAIVIDASASMSAAAGPPPPGGGAPSSRIDVARRVAKDLVSALAPGSDALVLEAGRDARVVSPLDRDLVRIKAAIDRVQVKDVEGDLGGAVALAVDRLRQLGGARRIIVVTDMNLARPASLEGAALPLEVIQVGEELDNAAIVRVDVRSGSDPALAREQIQAFLLVANFGKQPRELYVTMRQENASDVLASRRVLVQPGERLPVVLSFHPTPGDYRKGLIFEMSPHDALAIDDMAYGRVPAGDKLPVVLASADGKSASPWLERVMSADPMVSLFSASLASLAAPGSIDPDALVVIDGACPANPANLAGGDLLIVNPPAGKCFGTLVGATIENPVITSWETADPRMRFLTLDGVHVAKASSLKPDGATQELIRTQQGTIATDISTATRSGTLIGFDVGDSDWPLKASYVLFVRNILEQARAHRAHGMTGPARAGEPLRVAIPGTATNVEATGPRGEKLDVSIRGGLAVIPDTPSVGFYHLTWAGPQAGATLVPANLTSAAESDLSPKPIKAEGSKVSITSAGAEPDAHNEWAWVLALVALGLIVIDVWYLTRAPRLRAPAALEAKVLAASAPRPPPREEPKRAA
jgi:hypothetical protein